MCQVKNNGTKKQSLASKYLRGLVRHEGFEPSTLRLKGVCSTG